jgi:hypothetical protein
MLQSPVLDFLTELAPFASSRLLQRAMLHAGTWWVLLSFLPVEGEAEAGKAERAGRSCSCWREDMLCI